MELGYKASKRIFSRDQYGDWKYCDEDAIRRVLGDDTDRPIKLSVMADAERTDYHDDILPCDQSVLDVIRVACYIHQIPTAVDMIKDAHEKGYEVTLNLMAVCVVPERELDEALAVLAATPVDTIYLVDSFGALYSEQIRDMMLDLPEGRRGHGQAGRHARAQQPAARPTRTPSRPSSWAPTGWTPPSTAWVAAPATARWSCCSVS